MARLVDLGGAPVNAAEREIVDRLRKELPDTWSVIPNASLPDPRTGHSYEYDAICVGPHAIYVVEVKGWRGTVRQLGQTDWQLEGGRVERNPLTLTDQKARVLASHLKPLASRPYVQACLASGSDETVFEIFGTDARRCLRPSQLVPYLLDPANTGRSHADHRADHAAIVRTITGPLEARRAEGRRYGSWIATSLQERDEEHAVWLGRHALLDDQRVARIRAWYLSSYRYTPETRAVEHARRRRAADALARIGDHPRIARLLDFGESEGEFYEVTEWSRVGTLHTAFVRGALGRLRADQRVRIVRDIAEGLAIAARNGVLHRALSPEAVLLDAEGRARLTGFDLAFLAGTGTVYGGIAAPHAAFVAPELRNPANYEVFDNSDLFALSRMARLLFPELPPGVQALLTQCGADEPSVRPQDPDAFLRALDAMEAPPAPPAPAAAAIEPGHVLDGVNLVLAELGRGAGAVVYRVANEPLGRELALKLIVSPPDGYDPSAEYRLLRAVDSPHVPRAWWLGRLGPAGVPYLLLDLVDGDRLSTILARGPVPVDTALRWTTQLLGALDALHRASAGVAGVLHRDVKPDNIVIGPAGAVLVDFGAARESTDAGRAPEGSLRACPPDLAETGWAPQADVFAAACVTYELLGGRPPWPGAPTAHVVPVALDVLRPELPRAIAVVLGRALSPRAADRYADAAALREALSAAEAESGSPLPVVQEPREPGRTDGAQSIRRTASGVENARESAEPEREDTPSREPAPVGTTGARAPGLVGTQTSLAAAVDEAGTVLWTAARAQALTRHPDLAVPLTLALRACAVAATEDGPESARDALLASEANAAALEAPLPEAMPRTYDALFRGLAPAPLEPGLPGETRAARLPADGSLVVFDALHFSEWSVIEAAARALGRSVRTWAWAPSSAEGLESAFDGAISGAVVTLPRGDRAAVSLGALIEARRRTIEDTLLAALDGASGPVWVGANAGLVYLGHGLRRDVGEGLGDRGDTARAAWSAAFQEGRSTPDTPTIAQLPARITDPTRSHAGRRAPIGRLAWPDPPGTPWLQSGGLCLPERLHLVFCLEA